MQESATAAEELEFPQRLERMLRLLLGISFALVLLLPVAACCESLLVPGLPALDAGTSSPCARAAMNTLALVCGVFLLLLPPSRVSSAGGGRPVAALAFQGFIVVWTLSALTSVCVPDSLLNAIGWISAFIMFCAARALADTSKALENLIHLLLGVAAVVTMTSYRIWLTAPEGDAAITGAFYQADVNAGFILLFMPLAVALLVGAKRRDQVVFYGTISVMLLVSLVLTYSRGGLIAGALALLVVAVLMTRKASFRAWLVPVGLLGVAFALAGLMSSGGRSLVPGKTLNRAAELIAAATEKQTRSLAEREGKEADTSVTARLNFYRGGLRMALARPFLGWGPSTFGRVFPRYQSDVRYYSKYAHCAYVTVISEAGFAGGLALCALLGSLALAAYQQRRLTVSAGDWRFAAVCGLSATLVGVAAHIAVDVDWEFQTLVVVFAVLAGLLTSRGAVAPDASREEAVSAPLRTTLSAMGVRWGACVVLMALAVVQPFPFLSTLAEAEAKSAERSGNLSAAVVEQRRAVRLMPLGSGAQRQLSELLQLQAERDSGAAREAVDGAIAAARRAVALDGCRAVNVDALARALLGAGDWAGAEQYEREAIVCDPVNYPKFHAVLGEMLMQKGRDAEALALLRSIADRYPPETFITMWYFRRDALQEQLSQVWLLIATLRAKAGDGAQARADLERAVAMNGSNIAARFQLTTLLLNQREMGLALEQALAIARLKPRHPVSRWLLAICYRGVGQNARAASLFAALEREAPALLKTGKATQIPRDFFTPGPERSGAELPVEVGR